MIGFIKRAVLSLIALFMMSLSASAGDSIWSMNKKSSFDWNPVMDAIIQVESEGNPRAVSGNSVGVMQITPVLVKECNNILQKQKSNKRYTLDDRYSVEKSKEMFLLIQKYFNPENNVEKAIRSWNGGIKYSVKATNKYYQKVLARMK
jgi:hypothetical protein